MGSQSFSTKAETLQSLCGVITSATVSRLQIVAVSEWTSDPSLVCQQVRELFGTSTVIVRSSARAEDSATESLAGQFESVANVDPQDSVAVTAAVEKVIQSYGQSPVDDEQFFLQEQITDVSMSGVLFTREQDSLSGYYVINYDDESNSTETVTAGTVGGLKTYFHARCSEYDPPDLRFVKLLDLANELEQLFCCDHLDIEFAIDTHGKLFLFQVRPIVLAGKERLATDEQLSEYLKKISKKTRKLSGPHPGLCGKKGMYSVMTDWNPAEIIGVRPGALALSLYKELVTDGTWAYQRDNYGYKNLRSYPLLVSFLGLPYIDVRVSLNSFVPKAVGESLSQKLVDYYIDQLEHQPTHHDKVEFNVIYSCYFFNLASKVKALQEHGFSELELDRVKYALLDLTNAIICPDNGLYQKDLHKVQKLALRFDEVISSDLPVLDKIYWLVQDCKRYGTLPFAGLARAGFIAVQILRSFVDVGIFTQDEYQQFMNSLNTVAAQLTNDTERLQRGEISREQFLAQYGHLRPGTYDIESLRYDEAFEQYFHQSNCSSSEAPPEKFTIDREKRALIQHHIEQNGLLISADQLLTFITDAIEGREHSKFLFTRSLSEVLRLVEQLGNRYKISREEMSHINVQTLLQLYSALTTEDLKDILLKDIKQNKAAARVTKAIRLPQLIRSEKEIYQFFMEQSEPNFVTLSRVTEIITLEEDLYDVDLNGRIVFIRSADPGYDWLFSRNIAGLITMYGGINSHMAIRCAELQIPAVIGCGEKYYSLWSKASTLEIDCANKQVRLIN